MTDDGADTQIRQAIGGDEASIAWIIDHAHRTDQAGVIAMAALLEREPERLDMAQGVAVTRRDRQLLAIAQAHLNGDHEIVDGLARDHLVEFPDSLIVAWIAADAPARLPHQGQR